MLLKRPPGTYLQFCLNRCVSKFHNRRGIIFWQQSFSLLLILDWGSSWSGSMDVGQRWFQLPICLTMLWMIYKKYSVMVVIVLNHWSQATHICISKLTIIGSDNGLLPGRLQAIIWTNAEILLIRIIGTNFNEILCEIHIFSFKEMCLKVSSGKWQPFCLYLNVLYRCRYDDNR